MPVYYHEEGNKNHRRQNGNPNYATNANFWNYREPTNRATSDTDASSTGNHIGDLYRRHRMNQAEAQNDARQNWFQNARKQQTCDQGNSVFDQINWLNKHNPTNDCWDQQNQGPRGQEPQYHQNAAPQNLGASLHSLTEQINNMHMDLAAHPIQPQRMSMLPQQQQQVKNLKDNLSVAHVDLEACKLHINLFEAINQKLNLGLEDDLERSKHIHLQQAMRLEEEKQRLQKADNLASKFTAALEMPKIVQPPVGFRRETNLLDKKNMVRMITPYDDTSLNSTRSFKLVWTKILNFGRGEYLNKDDYKTILSIILRGNIAEDFRIMDKEGKSLKDIVDELCVLYDTTQTLEDFQKEVDDFKQEKNENLKKSMARANKLTRRLEPFSTEAARPETYNNMWKAILRQVVGPATRAHIDMEEHRLIKAGAVYDVDSLIKVAHEYGSYHNAIPTKDIQTVYQVASMAPRKSPMEITRTEDQLNYLKSEMSQNKGWEAKLEEVIQIAANAASYKDRSRSLNNKSKSNFKHTTSIQTPSQNRIKVLKYNDELMQDVSKSVGSNYCADKPAQQSNDQQQRGRQQDRRPSQSQSRSQSQNYIDQSSSSQGRSQSTSSQGQGTYTRNENDYHFQNKSSYNNNRAYPNRSQSQDNRPPPQQAERKIVWREPKLYVSGNRHYYDWATCATRHTADIVCQDMLHAEN
jgi:hypothetical protein